MGLKYAEFEVVFKSVEKSGKKIMVKSYQRKIEFFTFITVYKSVRPITSFG
jgi:hypothetical protein